MEQEVQLLRVVEVVEHLQLDQMPHQLQVATEVLERRLLFLGHLRLMLEAAEELVIAAELLEPEALAAVEMGVSQQAQVLLLAL